MRGERREERLLTEVHHPDVAAQGDSLVRVTGVVPAAGAELLPPLLSQDKSSEVMRS